MNIKTLSLSGISLSYGKLMNSLRKNLSIICGLVLLCGLTACSSDDEPSARSEYDIVGIWQDNADHILEIVDPDKLYEYESETFDDVKYWLKRKEMYFFEPYSYLMMKADNEGTMQLYKIVSVDKEEMVACWVCTPDMSGVDNAEGDDKFQIFSYFFKQDYTVDPDNFVTYKRISSASLEKIIEDGVLIEL